MKPTASDTMHNMILHILIAIFLGMEGFSLGQKVTNKCGMRASSTGELVFNDVKVPTENLLGEIGE